MTIETNDKNDKVEVTLKDVNIDTSSRNKAAVSVTGEGDIACRYSFAFSSIVGYGSMEFAKTPDEKRKGFDIIMQHQTGRSGFTYNDASLSVAEVFHVRADSFEASRKALRPRKPE